MCVHVDGRDADRRWHFLAWGGVAACCIIANAESAMPPAIHMPVVAPVTRFKNSLRLDMNPPRVEQRLQQALGRFN
jgi:hypothetical protein